jgi:hypothetical protein
LIIASLNVMGGRNTKLQPIPVVARSEAWVCGRSLAAGNAGSNPAEGTDVCLVYVVCFQVEVSASG